MTRTRTETVKSLNKIINDLAKKVAETQTSDEFKQYLEKLALFHNYSWHNVMLIMMTMPQATHVAGFRTWNKLGRFVKEGEHGIPILAPCFPKKKAEEKDNTTIDDEEDMFFRVVYVFDISQTQGKEIMTLNWRAEGTNEMLLEPLKLFAENKGIYITYNDELAKADGYSTGKGITIKKGLNPAQHTRTLIHEIAHELLHWNKKEYIANRTGKKTDTNNKSNKQTNRKSSTGKKSDNKQTVSKKTDRTKSTADTTDSKSTIRKKTKKIYSVSKKSSKIICETEADCTAYAVCRYFGIQTNSQIYLASWSTPELVKQSARRIQSLVHEIICFVENNLNNAK